MNVLYFYIFLLVHPYLAMWWKSFEQAGLEKWKALIPGYNYFVAFKLTCQKPWWSLLMIFPGVHLVMWAVVNLSYIRRFGYYTLVDTIQGIFFPYIIMAKIATSGDKILPETNWANSKQVGDREWGDHLVLFLGLPVIGHAIALGIASVTRPKPGKKTKVKEWGDSIWFALVAALVIRTYVFEPFKIPTGSMEKTLLVGDFLFVNKLAYGPKVPVTPLSYPLVHNTIPWVDVKSYLGIEKLDYTRLPGYTNVNRYDVMVFNYPSGDTAVYDPRMPFGLMGHNYHEIVIKEAKNLWQENNPHLSKIELYLKDSILRTDPKVNFNTSNNLQVLENMAKARLWEYNGQEFLENIESWKAKARHMLAVDKIAHEGEGGPVIEHYGLIYRPVDKRENYIKRCVGLPGDWIEIKNSVLYVNDKPAQIADNQNLQYIVDSVTVGGPDYMSDTYGLEAYPGYQRQDYQSIGGTAYMMNLTEEQVKQIKRRNPNATFDLVLYPQYSDNDSLIPTTYDKFENLKYFPNDINVNNRVSDFTRFQVPYKGQVVELNAQSIPWYRRVITAYEGHTFQEKEDGTILIDGKVATTYTVEMDYYWLMGDNRYNSADSRMWGYVPEDHVVGKASMVWFSSSPYKGVRWERVFNIIK